MEADTKDNGKKGKDAEEESIKTVLQNTIMRENGKMVKKKDMVTYRSNNLAFFRAPLPIIIGQDKAQKNSLVEIHTKDNMKEVNSMEKESMFGAQDLVSKVTSLKESSKDKANGDLKPDKIL